MSAMCTNATARPSRRCRWGSGSSDTIVHGSGAAQLTDAIGHDKQNQDKLRNVRLGVGIHIALAVAGSVFALFALLEIVPSLIDSPDTPACVECPEETRAIPTSSGG